MSSDHSYHARLQAALKLKRKPIWFADLMSEIIDAIEPLAKEFYAECKRLGHPGPFTARECYERRKYDPWANKNDREYILGFGLIADGKPFVSAAEEMQAWRDRMKQKSAASVE